MDISATALLPEGLADVLPPEAAAEEALTARLLAAFDGHGYDRVKPPLLEFETSLLTGPGAALARQTFRLMDPASGLMMGLRPDLTGQVARIARDRLGHLPRPLRLCYAGEVVRVEGSQLHPAREFAQAGCELIGSDAPEAEAEIIGLAAQALTAIGVKDLSVDLALPGLATALLGRAPDPELCAALDHRDGAALAAEPALAALARATGPAAAALPALLALPMPAPAAAQRDRLAALVALLTARTPGLTLTIDPLERRGFEYKSGLGFTLFARSFRGELGRGGSYLLGEGGEPACGFTLFLDALASGLPRPAPGRALLAAHDCDESRLAALRAEGWRCVRALAPLADAAAEARRLGLGHVLAGDDILEA